MSIADQIGSTSTQRDYFISYREGIETDKKWATWVRDVLHKAGLTTVMQAYDFKRTTDFIEEMHVALTGTDGTIAILSKDYFDSIYCTKEFFNSYHEWAKGKKDLILLKIDDFDHAGLLSSLLHYEIFRYSSDEQRAASFLLELIEKKSKRSHGTLQFPGSTESAAETPCAKSIVWNLPLRNSHFTGREDVLASIRPKLEESVADPSPGILAIHGLGGIGKTQIATEFAYRQSQDYGIIWSIVAETPEKLMTGYTQLLDKLDPKAKSYPDMTAKREQLREYLESCEQRWLLIFDNAVSPDDLSSYIPRLGNGSVLITSREQAWDETAEVLRLDLWRRAESIEYLLDRTGVKNEDDASLLAEKLGDYPLALAQASAYILQRRKTYGEYLDILEKHGIAALDRAGAVRDYKSSVSRTWQLSFEEIKSRSVESIDLLNLLACFSPDNIPVDCIIAEAELLPERLSAAAGDELSFDETLEPLISFAFVEAKQGKLFMHRLVQEAIRENLSEEEQKFWSGTALKIIAAYFPFEDDNLETWELTELMLPHALSVLKLFDSTGDARAAVQLQTSIAMYWFKRGRYKSSIARYDMALSLHAQHFGTDDPGYADILAEMSLPLMELGEYQQSLEKNETALRIDEQALGPFHENVGRDVNNLGEILRRLGKYESARKYYERALDISRRVFGAEHTNVATALGNLGLLLFSIGETAQAQENCEQALKIDEKLFGPEHPKVAIRLANVGGVLRKAGDLDQSRANYVRALDIFQKSLGPTHPNVAVVMNRLGSVYSEQGDVQSAKSMYERALQIYELAYGPEHPDVAVDLKCLGDVQVEMGDVDGARLNYTRARELFTRYFGPEHPSSVEVSELLEALIPKGAEGHGQ